MTWILAESEGFEPSAVNFKIKRGVFMKTTELVQQAISPLFEGLDIELVEVEYVKKVDGMHLIVYIDKDGGITLEDCERVSKMIDPVIDELNPTNDETYRLDVSSYGIDKPLKYDWQYDKYMDQKVSVTLYKKVDELKAFDAILKGYGDTYTFDIDGKIVEIEKDLVARVLPYIEF